MKPILGIAIALSVFAKTPEPSYDATTVIDVKATVAEVREIPQGQALAGLHLFVNVDSQTLDIYVGPTEFVKVFNLTFAKGDAVRVIGSKIDLVVLAREVTLGEVTLVCRDKEGSPLWKYFIKPPVG
jgi:hypothetical protein